MARLLRREGKFFDFFNEHADLAMLAAAELKALLDDIGELELRRRNIERYEKQADHITHQTIALLHKTFITPLDRDEIHQLITTMDDILDLMEDVAQCLFLYDVRAVTSEARRLADICVACIAKVKEAVAKLESMDDADAIVTQARTLGGLVRHARRTRFGRDHRFDRIDSVAGARRRGR